MNNDRKIEIFRSLFRGRADAYGTVDGKNIKKPLTESVLLGHLNGKRRVGMYPLSMDILKGRGVYFAVIDIDDNNLELAMESQSKLAQLGVNAYIETSKSKGFHVWVFYSEPVEASKARALMQYATGKNEIFPKQTVIYKGQYGNYINLPLFEGSVRENKTVFIEPYTSQPYQNQWEFLQSIQKVTPKQIDDLLESGELEPEADITTFPGQVEERSEYVDMLPCVPAMMKGVGQGCRDVVAFTLAKHFRQEKNLPESATLAILNDWNLRNKPPLTEKEIKTKVKSAYKGAGGKGYTSYGCENDLIRQFCPQKKCPVYKEYRREHEESSKEDFFPGYFRKNTFLPPRMANELMLEYSFIDSGGQMYIYLDGVYRPVGIEFLKRECRERLKDEARTNHINEVIAHIRDMNRVDSSQLNTHRELINLNNGMLDWEAGELIKHDKKYLSTIRIPVSYSANMDMDRTWQFLESTLIRQDEAQDDHQVLDLVAEMLGYCLIPDVSFHKAFMLTGTGSNGKSTFLSLLERFIGSDNTAKIPLQEICDHRFKRAELYGKLVNIFADLDNKSLQSTSYFKTIVSGDAIDAERKNQDPFSFRPFSRMIFSANEIPKSPDRSYAYYRRWCIVPFPNTFRPGENEDKKILQRITREEELSGLLNFSVNGLKRLHHQQRFTEPEPVKKALDDYMKFNDTVEAFIQECCEIGLNYSVERQKAYDRYTQYCTKEGYQPVTRNQFYSRLRSKPQIQEHRSESSRQFLGIRIKENDIQ